MASIALSSRILLPGNQPIYASLPDGGLCTKLQYYTILPNQKTISLLNRTTHALGVLSYAAASERFVEIEPTIFVEIIAFRISSHQNVGILGVPPNAGDSGHDREVWLFQSRMDIRGRMGITVSGGLVVFAQGPQARTEWRLVTGNSSLHYLYLLPPLVNILCLVSGIARPMNLNAC